MIKRKVYTLSSIYAMKPVSIMNKMFLNVILLLALLIQAQSLTLKSSTTMLTRRKERIDHALIGTRNKFICNNLFKMCQSSISSLRMASSESPTATTTSSQIYSVSNNELINSFITSWRSALKGDQTSLNQLLNRSTKWENPYVSTVSELNDGLNQFSNFFQDPALTIFNIKQNNNNNNNNIIEIDYQISFWYPTFWRPRIIIPGKAFVKLSNDGTKIELVKEIWDVDIGNILLKQFPPRLWDIWHLFTSPTPEYPPIKSLFKTNDVNIEEIPSTIALEAKWEGLSKYLGPPLLTVTGFSLFGKLRTSRPNRDPYYTVLPVEIQSRTFVDKSSGLDMKQSTWIYHVPTCLQEKIMKNVELKTVFDFNSDDDSNNLYSKIRKSDNNNNSSSSIIIEDDLVQEIDYQTGVDNISLLKSVTGGISRGNYTFDVAKMEEFETFEKKSYSYKIIPKRYIASTNIKGDPTPEKIGEALNKIKSVVYSSSNKSKLEELFNTKNKISLKPRDIDFDIDIENSNSNNSNGGNNEEDKIPMLGLQLWNCKVGFNPIGEPAMAVYEIQYGSRLTKVFVEFLL